MQNCNREQISKLFVKVDVQKALLIALFLLSEIIISYLGEHKHEIRLLLWLRGRTIYIYQIT